MTHRSHHVTYSLALAALFLVGGISTAAADEPADESSDDEQVSASSHEYANSPGSAIVDSENTGLELGDDVSTDDALANVEGGRKSDDDTESKGAPRTSGDGDGHLCEPFPSCARADLGSRPGELDVERFQKVVNSNSDQIRSCYQGALDGDESGKILLHITIDSTGAPNETRIAKSTIGGNDAHECARKTVSNWDFPEPSEFGYVITHPITFGGDQ